LVKTGKNGEYSKGSFWEFRKVAPSALRMLSETKNQKWHVAAGQVPSKRDKKSSRVDRVRGTGP